MRDDRTPAEPERRTKKDCRIPPRAGETAAADDTAAPDLGPAEERDSLFKGKPATDQASAKQPTQTGALCLAGQQASGAAKQPTSRTQLPGTAQRRDKDHGSVSELAKG